MNIEDAAAIQAANKEKMKAEEKALQTIKEGLKEQACWVGEDGNAVVAADTEEEALAKFKELWIEAYGEDGPELDELKLEEIGIGWLHLPDEPNSEFEWFVSYSKHSPFEVFVYYP